MPASNQSTVFITLYKMGLRLEYGVSSGMLKLQKLTNITLF